MIKEKINSAKEFIVEHKTQIKTGLIGLGLFTLGAIGGSAIKNRSGNEKALPRIDCLEEADWISEKSGVDKDTVCTVLDYDIDYMICKGVAEGSHTQTYLKKDCSCD